MSDQIHLSITVPPEQAGTYFTLPFTLPDGVDTLTLRYAYDRYIRQPTGGLTAQLEANIIDLGLIAPDGRQVGASGSDKTEIFLSTVSATPGYQPWPLETGEWRILVGAYKVAPGGVTVSYEIEFTRKTRRLFRGDLHTHTLASDGVLTVEELARHAAAHGLDYLAVTDHNQMVSAEALPHIPGLTLIPGVEWTHYQGHANFLGVDRPYDEPFATNTPEEAYQRFISARNRGATITINHPNEECCVFRFDLQSLPFDAIEIWNGPMRESNLRALGLWQGLLAQGRKIPACGGSDYHRDTPFIFLGGPTTAIYAQSASPADLLSALRRGNACITFAPNGPTLDLSAGEARMGDSIAWWPAAELEIDAGELLAGDVLRVVTATTTEVLLQASAPGRFHGAYRVPAPGFARVEILRAFLPGLPLLPALISNPVYFDG